MATTPEAMDDLTAVAEHFREILSSKKYVLLYAHNGTGKTRLSMTFKDLGRNEDERDTLYFNAFTEDLFYWDNNLDNDTQRELRLNRKSKFFEGLEDLEMDTRIREFLVRYANFDFKILNKVVRRTGGRDKEVTYVSFEKEELIDGKLEPVVNIKVSRGEENIFIWCFFLAIARLAIDSESEDSAYSWVKYIYIDDPISSLDDNNAITIASHLAQLLKKEDNKKKIVISTHHTLFFNVMCNELGCVDIYRIIDNHSVMTRLTLSDAQWAKIAPYCAGKETDVGRTAVNNRLFIEAVLWIVRTGSPWRDLPPEFGNWNSVYKRYRRWVKSDRFSKLFNALNDSDLEYAMIDGTIVKVHRHGQGAKGGLVIRQLANQEAV